MFEMTSTLCCLSHVNQARVFYMAQTQRSWPVNLECMHLPIITITKTTKKYSWNFSPERISQMVFFSTRKPCGAYRCKSLLHDLLVSFRQHNNTSPSLTIIGERQLLNDSQTLVVPAEHKRMIAARKVKNFNNICRFATEHRGFSREKRVVVEVRTVVNRMCTKKNRERLCTVHEKHEEKQSRAACILLKPECSVCTRVLPFNNAALSLFEIINSLSDAFRDDSNHQGEDEHSSNSDGERDQPNQGTVCISMGAWVCHVGPRLP